MIGKTSSPSLYWDLNLFRSFQNEYILNGVGIRAKMAPGLIPVHVVSHSLILAFPDITYSFDIVETLLKYNGVRIF